MKKFRIGIDVGGTKIAYGLFDSSNNIVAKYKMPSEKEAEPEAFCDILIEQIDAILKEHGIERSQLDGVGIAMPSFILFEEGYLIKTANLPKLKEFAMGDYMKNALGVKVVLDNDANAAALAEFSLGAGKGFEHIIYCPVSTGISSGIIINRQIFRGSYGWAGETGHMIADIDAKDERICACGNKGCFESHASGGRIVQLIADKIRAGEKSIMSDLCANRLDTLSAEHLLVALNMGDPLAVWAVEHMAKYLGIWLYNLYLVLNINCFVFGGGLVNFGDHLFGRAREVFDSYNQDKREVHFKFAQLGSDFGIIGAALLI